MSNIEDSRAQSSADDEDEESTGLPWPKTWRGSYIAVSVIFAVWVSLLVTLGEIF